MISLARSASLVQTAAVENLRKGQKVRVNAVAPGMIKTDLLPGNLTEKEEFAPEYFTDPIGKLPTRFCSPLLTIHGHLYRSYCECSAIFGVR